jgi:outer membrane protein TolC
LIHQKHPQFPRLAAALLLIGGAYTAAYAQVSLTTIVELAQQKSVPVRVAQADLQRVSAQALQARDPYIPSFSFGSGLPAFPEVGFTGELPNIWSASVQSLVFSMPQIRNIQGSRFAVQSAQFNLKDAREQVALDASLAYLELDTVTRELEAARQQDHYAERLVSIEQQRTDAGVDPLGNLLQAKLTAAQLRLARLHLETRANTLAKQLEVLTGLPATSILPEHSSIPEIPAMTGESAAPSTAAVDAARAVAQSKQFIAKGDEERAWTPQIAFGILYNRNTTLLNEVNLYYAKPLPANNLSSGFSITVPLFDASLRDRARESAADALKAKIDADQAQRQYDLQLTTLNSSLRELGAQAEVTSLKQQIADDQLKTVLAQMELEGGSSQRQISPTSEQESRIDERQKYTDALEADFMLAKARLSLIRAVGRMQDWLDELHAKP